MNGNVSRRVFVGSLAGAGVGAVGATSLLDFPVSAQPVSAAPLTREIRRQLKEAFGKMRDGQSGGARQAATVLRLYATTVNDSQLQAALRKVNRQQILLAQTNHGDLVRQAEELGIDPSRMPQHSLDRVGREAAFARLVKEGVSPLMREVADYVDAVGTKMERLERSGRARPLQVALRQPIPTPTDCGNCDQERGQVDTMLNIVTVTCAAAAFIPILLEACAAVSAAYISVYIAYAVCSAVVAFCDAYYN